MDRKLRYGMVGGGPGAFIGAVHRRAINMLGAFELVSGCFSYIEEEIIQAGKEFGIAPDRNYMTYQEMAEKEAAREDCIDFVVIVTPNRFHYDCAKLFLNKGINVVCEKPLCFTVAEAEELKEIAVKKGCLFAVTYTYTGHVMAKEARDIIRSGKIGDVRIVMAEYPQDWLLDSIENVSADARPWRTEPKMTGRSNCVGDIGSHTENMITYMTGLKIKKLCANLDVFGQGGTLDNNAEILLKFDNGASGSLWCSQVAIGYDNALRVRVFGSKGSVEFVQEEPNSLYVTMRGGATQKYSRGAGYISPAAAKFSRLPCGHPEGFHDAYANIYAAFAEAVRDKLAGKKVNEEDYGYPTVDMGIEGVKFINACVDSAEAGSAWIEMK
jgi:predicted dehydrogenase